MRTIALRRIVTALIVLAACGIYWIGDSARREQPPGTKDGEAGAAKVVATRESDVEHGARELARMLADRPTMALVIQPGDEIARWLVARFDGKGLGFRVYWNPQDLDSTLGRVFAASRGPTEGERAEIRIRELPFRLDGEEKPTRIGTMGTAERLCASAVFEMFNLEGWAKSQEIHTRALEGRLSRTEYIELRARKEHEAALKRTEFFRSTWIPHAQRLGIESRPYLWGCDVGSSYEEWIGRFVAADHPYPEVPYGVYWDRVIAPYLRRKSARSAGD